MMTATASHSTFASLPNFRAFSLTEGLRLAMIVGSLSFVILAGQFAQSRNQALSEAATKSLTNAVKAHAQPVARPAHRTTAIERYTRAQIQTFSELLDGLTERAEIVLATAPVSEADQVQLKTSLQKMDEDLMAARAAFARYQRTSDKFNEEEMRETLIAVQASAAQAQGEMITLDQGDHKAAQSFKVSRIGQ